MGGGTARAAEFFKKIARHLQALIFGFDFFISYRTRDAAVFAGSLQKALNKKGFDCFLDNEHYEAGGQLQRMQTAALNRSTKLLVLVSPEAHNGPSQGIDWLLAEILEYKSIHLGKSSEAPIVSIGTRETLDRHKFPGSKILKEIPSPDEYNICIFDDGLQRNEPVAEATVNKLDLDFAVRRKRRLRKSFLGFGLAALLLLLSATLYLRLETFQKDKQLHFNDAMTLVDQGRNALTRNDVTEAEARFDGAISALRKLNHDPVLALHGKFAARLRKMRAQPVAEVNEGVSFIRLSDDGKYLLVTYDYQNSGGDPDIESIPNWDAFGVFNLSAKKWILKKPLNSEIGARIYRLDESRIIQFEAPDTVWVKSDDPNQSLGKISLTTGEETIVTAPPPSNAKPATEQTVVPGKAQENLARFKESVFTPFGPRTGYSPRQVESTLALSPDHRSALLGNWQGRILLADLGTGLSRGEMQTSPIFAATYRADGKRAYFCDAGKLWEVDTSGWPEVGEHSFALRKPEGDTTPPERILALALSNDASRLALATTQRLACLNAKGNTWESWPLNKIIENVAALQIDQARGQIDLVVADDGSIYSVSYGISSSLTELSPSQLNPNQGEEEPGDPVSYLACFDKNSSSVWITKRSCPEGEIQLIRFDLKEKALPPRKISSRLQFNEADLEDRENRAVHCLAIVDREMLVFYGSAEYQADNETDLQNEKVRRISLKNERQSGEDSILFQPEWTDIGVEVGHQSMSVTQVKQILSGTGGTPLLARTQSLTYPPFFVIPKAGNPEPAPGNLAAQQVISNREIYRLALTHKENQVSLAVTNQGKEITLNYDLPWNTDWKPKYAELGPNGLQIVIVGEDRATSGLKILNLDLNGLKAFP